MKSHKHKYDIFISYRRDGGAQYARTLQLMLENKGYRVFLDYDELRDGRFRSKIDESIRNSTTYILILSPGSMQRCVNADDWLRHEIEIAIEADKQIIPIVPDAAFDGFPDDMPDDIREYIQETQYSEISFGQALKDMVDKMVAERIAPHIHRKRKSVLIASAALLLLIAGGIVAGSIISMRNAEAEHLRKAQEAERQRLMSEIKFDGDSIYWAKDVTKEQLLAVKEILQSMSPSIEGGEFMLGAEPLPDGSYDETVELDFEVPAVKTPVKTFRMNKYEVTVGQWNAIMGDNRPGNPKLPVTNVSFTQAQKFVEKLGDFTMLNFSLPTESQWEYAAKGGNTPEGFKYAGGDDLGEVAWYSANSHGKPQEKLPARPTVHDLFNMSGNVSEWCDTRFAPYDKNSVIELENSMVIRGGNYESDPYELTVTHREPLSPETMLPTVGFRIVINNAIK